MKEPLWFTIRQITALPPKAPLKQLIQNGADQQVEFKQVDSGPITNPNYENCPF